MVCRYLVVSSGTPFPPQFLATFNVTVGYEAPGAPLLACQLQASDHMEIAIAIEHASFLPLDLFCCAASNWNQGNDHGVCPPPPLANGGDAGYCKGTKNCDNGGYNCRCILLHVCMQSVVHVFKCRCPAAAQVWLCRPLLVFSRVNRAAHV